MTTAHRLVGLSVLLFSFSHLSATSSNSREKLTLARVSQLKPGTTTKEETKRILGPPARVSDLKEAESGAANVELWEYLEKGTVRLSVSFPSGSKGVDSWTWHVYAGEPEENLKTALQVFPGASWKGETEEWINPHSFPTQCFYKEEKQGITISYNEVRKEVDSISRRDPARAPSSGSSNTTPPKYCIGDGCANGIPAKQWAKEGAMCEVPK